MRCANCGKIIDERSIQYSEVLTDFRITYYFCTEACCRTWLQQRQITHEVRTDSSAPNRWPVRG